MTAKYFGQWYFFTIYPYWFRTYPYWIIPPFFFPSQDRQHVVQSEGRELEVSSERYRIFVVPVEDRTDDVG